MPFLHIQLIFFLFHFFNSSLPYVSFMWNPSHVGNSGNELTDQGWQNWLCTSSSLQNTPFPIQFTLVFPTNGSQEITTPLVIYLEPPYISSSPQSSLGHPATILPVLKKQPCAVVKSQIHHSTRRDHLYDSSPFFNNFFANHNETSLMNSL